MNENKEQKIVVFTEFKDCDKSLILNGLKIASIFKKELCLLYNYKKKQKSKYQKFKQKLHDYTVPLKTEIPNLQVSTLLLSENQRNIADTLADNHEAIMIVANTDNFKNHSKGLSESPIPYLFVKPGSQLNSFNNITQPIDLRKDHTDCTLWCSYFGRFNSAEIVVVAANDSSKEGKYQVAKNVNLTRKLYRKFKIDHKVYKGTKNSLHTSFESLDFALASDCNLLVMLGSSTITPLDLLIGLPERKIVKRAGNLPVLIINPRKDNYILCD